MTKQQLSAYIAHWKKKHDQKLFSKFEMKQTSIQLQHGTASQGSFPDITNCEYSFSE